MTLEQFLKILKHPVSIIILGVLLICVGIVKIIGIIVIIVGIVMLFKPKKDETSKP